MCRGSRSGGVCGLALGVAKPIEPRVHFLRVIHLKARASVVAVATIATRARATATIAVKPSFAISLSI
ncbi:hypothetical protein NL676_015417 [Syzygium grande]|nr:hypothetical protein NL676_015417 [Syzygium grande]